MISFLLQFIANLAATIYSIKVDKIMRFYGFLTFLAILFVSLREPLFSQTNQNRIAATSNVECGLNGTYRIDVAESDKLYSVVKEATGKVPLGEQQQFFMDLSVRLTPPDILAIECSGKRVSIGSSRAPRVTFVVDGRVRNERNTDGSVVRSRIVLENNTLTLTSDGKAEDNVNVTLAAFENGKRLRVSRRIYAEQVNEPILIQTIYNKVADSVRWNNFDDALIASNPPAQEDKSNIGNKNSEARQRSADAGSDEAVSLRNALDRWIEATNKKDIEKQISFYMPKLKAFYLAREVPRSSVQEEKNKAFAAANSIDIRAEDPEIIFQDTGRIAIMRFHKKYRVAYKSKVRSGEVIQELRWQQTANGWRIFSERDIKVIR